MTCKTFLGGRHDRLLHMDDGQRLQAARHAGGDRPAAPNHSGRSAQEGADGTGLHEDQPGDKIPAIVDHDGPGGAQVTVCESGAILKYLAEKSGKFYPSDAAGRAKVDQWLFYGSATFTTLAQQFGHWVIRSPVKPQPTQD